MAVNIKCPVNKNCSDSSIHRLTLYKEYKQTFNHQDYYQVETNDTRNDNQYIHILKNL